uniref:Methyltransf_11 domain-containing protein n=1 Tax=Steinernema glaseri TaxID=37863 RepID=A0A1I7ZMU6_9BILA
MPRDDEKQTLQIVDSIRELSEPIRAHTYLYEKTLSMCPSYPRLRNFKILEIGCGSGAGIHWIRRVHSEVDSVKGLDIVAVDCLEGSIIQGNAEKLPFNDSQFDLILNIESSHLYTHPNKFFAECSRVLRSGGFLCWADLRFSEVMGDVETQAQLAKFHTVAFENITEGVLRGVNYTSYRYDKMIERAPWYVKLFRKTLRITYCAPGTESHERLLKRQKIYAAACWRKSA